MFLRFPVMLERLSLPSEIKARFRELRSDTEKSTFVRLPGTASVWQDLQIYQATALKQLTGLGLLKRDALRDRYASLEFEQVPAEILARSEEHTSELQSLMRISYAVFCLKKNKEEETRPLQNIIMQNAKAKDEHQ